MDKISYKNNLLVAKFFSILYIFVLNFIIFLSILLIFYKLLWHFFLFRGDVTGVLTLFNAVVMAFWVLGPTIPSKVKAFAFWKFITAVLVSLPKIPSVPFVYFILEHICPFVFFVCNSVA